MDRERFDAVFSGTTDEQTVKCAHFLGGFKQRLNELERAYFIAVVDGDQVEAEGSLAFLKELGAVYDAFHEDPRLAKVKKDAVLEQIRKVLK